MEIGFQFLEKTRGTRSVKEPTLRPRLEQKMRSVQVLAHSRVTHSPLIRHLDPGVDLGLSARGGVVCGDHGALCLPRGALISEFW